MGTGWSDRNWRRWKVESIRRSLAMIHTNQAAGLSRDEAMALVVETQRLQEQLEHVRAELRRLLDEPD